MAAPVTREKVFKIIFLFISSFKSYVNSEHKVATLKKNFLLKNNDFSPIFQYACIPVCSFVPLVLFQRCTQYQKAYH